MTFSANSTKTPDLRRPQDLPPSLVLPLLVEVLCAVLY
jgi:hypothetical protein